VAVPTLVGVAQTTARLSPVVQPAGDPEPTFASSRGSATRNQHTEEQIMTGSNGQFVGRFVSETVVWVGGRVMVMRPRDAQATYTLLGYYPPLR